MFKNTNKLGSQSVHLHVLSPASKGLFQRAILVSGAASNPSVYLQESQLPGLIQFADSMGQPNLTINQLIKFLQNVDPHVLANSTNRPFFVTGTERKEFFIFYTPVVEKYISKDTFLAESAITILESHEFTSDVSIMFSSALGESYLFIDNEMRDPTLLEPFNQGFEIQFPLYVMNRNLNYSSVIYKETAQRIRRKYFLDLAVGRETMLQYSALITDVEFSYGIDRSVRLHAAKSSVPIYYYRLDVDTAFNLAKRSTVAATYNLPGATHGDEHFYTFGAIESLRLIYESVPADSVERRLVKQISSMYTNFIAYGNPTPPGDNTVYFEPVRVGEHNYLAIGNNYTQNRNYPRGNTPIFWDNLFTEFKVWKMIKKFYS